MRAIFTNEVKTEITRNDIVSFWYNNKFRKLRVTEVQLNSERPYICGEMDDCTDNLYNRNIESGEFRSFTIDKITNGTIHIHGRATDRRGVPYGDADFEASMAHVS